MRGNKLLIHHASTPRHGSEAANLSFTQRPGVVQPPPHVFLPAYSRIRLLLGRGSVDHAIRALHYVPSVSYKVR